MTKSQIILAALTALLALQACAKTYREPRSPESLSVARAEPRERTARRTPPVVERCAETAVPAAPVCGAN